MSYKIIQIACNTGNYTRQQNTHKYIVIHYTATVASVYNEGAYFKNNSNLNASAHFFIDGGGVIVESVPRDYVAWHAGNWNCNCCAIGIEVTSDGADFTEAEISELTYLVQKLMKDYDIPPTNVIRHYDVADYFSGSTVSPHKQCPRPYIDNAKWQMLKNRLINGKQVEEMTPEEFWSYKINDVQARDRLQGIDTQMCNFRSLYGWENEINGVQARDRLQGIDIAANAAYELLRDKIYPMLENLEQRIEKLENK